MPHVWIRIRLRVESHWYLPLIFAVIEGGGLQHMVGGLQHRLRAEQVPGISNVPAHIRRHGGEGLEDPVEDFRVCLNYGIGRIGDVCIYRPVVRIDHDLHAVAHVARSIGHSLRVRVCVAHRVRVENPLELPRIGDDEVRIFVELQEGQRRACPHYHVSAVENARVGLDVVGEENLQRSELPRVKHTTRKRPDGNSARPCVVGVDVLVAGRVVELGLSGADEDVAVGQLAVVDLWSLEVDRDRRNRRQVLDEEYRQPLARHLVDRRHRHTHSVCECKALVDEGSRRQGLNIQLARRDVHLPVIAVDHVAVVIDRDKIIVCPDLLELAERLIEEITLPEPDVVHGGSVGGDIRHGQFHFTGEILRFDLVEPPRLSRRGDVVAKVRGLTLQLIGRNDQLLVGGGNNSANHQAHDDINDGRRDSGPDEFVTHNAGDNPDRGHERDHR